MSPAFVPGLIFSAVCERFPKQTELQQAQIPDIARATFPEMRYTPTVVMHGSQLSLYVGPRCFFLGMDRPDYPGWPVYRETLAWVLEKVRPLKLITVPERLGLRYTDFFAQPLADSLQVDLIIGGRSELAQPLQVTSYLQRRGHVCKLQVNSHGVLQTAEGARQGCLLDVDVGFGAEPQLFWEQVSARFDQAHAVQKEIFFLELIKPAFLAKLHPEY